MTDWSPQQDAALREVAAWLATPSAPQVFYLAGFAGSGKSTLARHLAADAGDVEFAAFTGKAAYVMRQKGCPHAGTIHQLIYHPNGDSNASIRSAQRALDEHDLSDPGEGKRSHGWSQRKEMLEADLAFAQRQRKVPSFRLNPDSRLRHVDLLVVDECSMVGSRIGEDVESYGTRILVLGDPAQLPPVGDGGYWTNRTPDVMLTEVHRQAAESSILRLATKVRQGGEISVADRGGDLRILFSQNRDEIAVLAQAVDQIIVGRNRTRHLVNARMRQLAGISDPFPIPGDKVICLRNDHKAGLLNGSLWRVHNATPPVGDILMMQISSEEDADDVNHVIDSHSCHFLGDDAAAARLGFARKSAQEFAYGYAITCHKAQGSQWSSVLGFDEGYTFKEDAQRWRYTMITRAADELTVVI